MKKILLAIATVMVSVGMNAQKVTVYDSENAKHEFTNPQKVVFSDGDITEPKYVEITNTDGTKLKWATMNLGASTVAESAQTCYGDYYTWGEVDTYYSSVSGTTINWKSSTDTHITGTKTGYNWANYCGNDATSFTEWNPAPYDATTNNLSEEYDVVKKTYGASWRMPTQEDFNKLYTTCGGSGVLITEIIDNTTAVDRGKGVYYLNVEGCTVNDVKYNVTGALFISSDIDRSLCVFFPTAGHCQDMVHDNAGGVGLYWSSTKYGNNGSAHRLILSKYNINPKDNCSRCLGLSIRPVSE